jgi:ferritin
MVSNRMKDAINKQINAEIYSAYLYLAMAAQAEDLRLPGTANWFKVQFQEELTHAMKFYTYLAERGVRIELAVIAGPPTKWKGPEQMFKDAYEHEVKVSGMISALVDLALADKDHMTNSLLQWFITEQIEEEKNTSENVDKFRMAGKNEANVYLIDKELAARVFTPMVGMIPSATVMVPGA